MTRLIHCVVAMVSVALLCACATTPPIPAEKLAGVDPNLTPEQVVDETLQEGEVLWGGVVIAAENRPDQTILTVLYYPLDNSQRPDLGKTPLRRFKVYYPGYLETMVYAPGRKITVLGSVQGVEQGKVDEAPYRYAKLKAVEIYLWPPADQDSRVRFGVGVGIGIH